MQAARHLWNAKNLRVSAICRVSQRWSSTPSSGTTLPELTLFTKAGECSLCDEMKMSLEPYLSQICLKEVDITQPENEHWRARYKYEIPVVHYNGKILMKHRLSKETLEQALKDTQS